MAKFLKASEFLNSETHVMMDVRSPGEFAKAHIPGAVSLPLFSDRERAHVGTCYKQDGPEEAMLLGLEFVGPKMASFVREARRLNPEGKPVRMYCFRGGQRSQSMAWLLEKGGFQIELLEGGYKAFRRYILASFEEQQEFIVLSGCTGSAKTKILLELRALGEQVIDLEGLAQHRGSAFGGYHQPADYTTEMFQNLLWQEWRATQRHRRLWVEDECRNLGKVYIPDGFWLQMRAAPVIFLDLEQSHRVRFLVQEYGDYDSELLMGSVDRIAKRLGPQRHKECREAMEQGNYSDVVRHTLNYYDEAYLYSLTKRCPEPLLKLRLEEMDIERNARKILTFAQEELEVRA